MALPTQVTELWSVWKDMSGQGAHPVSVNLYGPTGEHRDALRRLFLANSEHADQLRVRDLSAELPPEADIHLVVLDAAFGPPSSQVSLLRKINPKALLLLLPGIEADGYEKRRREVATAVGVKVEQVLGAKTVELLEPLLATRLLTSFEEFTVPLARQFPFLRSEAGSREIGATSQQNAMVGAFPVPGADLPIMTANQVKMVMRIAAMYDQPMTYDRLKEVMAVVGGGFALRTAARQLAKFIPGPGWLISGGLGFTGTMAIGKASVEYFKRQTLSQEPAGASPSGVRPDAIDTEATVVEKN